jgi:hypothetical protein
MSWWAGPAPPHNIGQLLNSPPLKRRGSGLAYSTALQCFTTRRLHVPLPSELTCIAIITAAVQLLQFYSSYCCIKFWVPNPLPADRSLQLFHHPSAPKSMACDQHFMALHIPRSATDLTLPRIYFRRGRSGVPSLRSQLLSCEGCEALTWVICRTGRVTAHQPRFVTL